MCFAIKEMVVRGAPSIGVAAAFGLAAHAVRLAQNNPPMELMKTSLQAACLQLQATRPTAVNLRWATDKLWQSLFGDEASMVDARSAAAMAVRLAETMLDDHIAVNKRLSDFGAELIKDNDSILTHCNAGPLAACGWGTALGVIRSATMRGLNPHVYVDETRPRNQGSRLTVWELHQDRIPYTLICDSMSGHVMAAGKVQVVITGADRIALNGDTANKIGTYNLAIVAQFHQVPFYIAAPLSTVDGRILSGKEIPIEERNPQEITDFGTEKMAMTGAHAYNPAFDVTPFRLIAGIITEYGVLRAPYTVSIKEALEKAKLG
jgi:methylthioribose-1-phosphate isomerase